VVPQIIFEKTDYVTSFPQLIGSVRVFNGDNAAHGQILRARRAGQDWTAQLGSSDLMMLGCLPSALRPRVGAAAAPTSVRCDRPLFSSRTVRRPVTHGVFPNARAGICR
jgi:hypothetical protein